MASEEISLYSPPQLLTPPGAGPIREERLFPRGVAPFAPATDSAVQVSGATAHGQRRQREPQHALTYLPNPAAIALLKRQDSLRQAVMDSLILVEAELRL